MPTLRFARDKRGYETTSLVHAFRHHGRARQRILYWFRSPPNVKVGRPALDEEAIRWIEEHNPDIEFNWQKILEAQPPPPRAPAEDEKGRGRRARREPRRPGHPSRSAPARPPRRDPSAAATEAEAIDQIADLGAAPVDAREQIAPPDLEEQPGAALTPVEAVVGHEQLARFRARFAELQARITERGGDPVRVEALRAQAESLNPDAWVTEAEARQGLADFDLKVRELRNALGLRRRRRSRRGGRRRHKGSQGPQIGPQDSASGSQEPADLTMSGAPDEHEETGEPDEPDEQG